MGKFNKKSNVTPEGSQSALRDTREIGFNSEYQQVAAWLKSVRFRKKLLGGYDPADVWKKLDELNSLYERALIAERARYDLMLEQMSSDTDPEEFYV